VATTASASPGALGGSANEQGAEYRARVGALLATAVLRGSALDDVGLPTTSAVPVVLQAESDDPVDDLVVMLADGSHVYVQAKTSVGFSTGAAKPFCAALQQFAAAVRSGLRVEDRLVLACARPTRPVERLQTVLDRRRHAAAGAPTRLEQQAWDAFSRLAHRSGITVEELEKLASHLVIWPTDPTADVGEAMLVARLEGHVVASGQGLNAARDLSDEVRALARLRAGSDAVQLAQALERRGRTLVGDGRDTSAVTWARALSAYKARLVRDGTTLRLFGAPSALRDLPLADADAGVEVTRPEDDRDTGHRLNPSLRRRGRIVLVGRPGGGKTTALRSAGRHGRMKNGRRLGAHSPPKPYQPPPAPEGKINLTDLDSRNVKTPRGWVQGYNAQAVTTEDQIVIAAEVHVSSADFGQLEPMIAAARRELARAGIEQAPEVVLADAGYWHHVQMERLAGDGVTVLVPPDASKRAGARPGWNGGLYAFMRRVLATDQGGALYAKRQGMIEPGFADTKFNRGVDRFLRRGRAAARSEWRLTNAAHNLRG
jgi:hypothetical protein